LIRYLHHNEIDKSAWDRCLADSKQDLIYAHSWYLDIVAPDWEALVEDDYVSIFPLTCRKKFGINYLFQPYFTQQLGLFSAGGEITENKLNDFLIAIPQKFRLIEIQLNTNSPAIHAEVFKSNKRKTHHLDLAFSYESIRKNYSENLVRNIKKAEKAGLKKNDDTPFESIIQSFRENKGSEIENLSGKDYKTFSLLLKSALQKNVLEVLGINNIEGKLIAGAIFLHSSNSYIFLFSSANEEAKEKGAMSFLIDSFIQNHSNENKILDFEGSMNENLSRFYKSFGSKEVVYLQILKNNLPLIIRWLK
jgi:hypothetical protein